MKKRSGAHSGQARPEYLLPIHPEGSMIFFYKEMVIQGDKSSTQGAAHHKNQQKKARQPHI